MRIVLACILLLFSARALANEASPAIVGAGSLAGAVAANTYLKQLDSEGLSAKFKHWEDKDQELWKTLEKRNRLRTEVKIYRDHMKGYNRRLMRGYASAESELHKTNEDFFRLVKETSRTHVIDFTLGEFTGERRALMNKLILANSLKYLSYGGGLVAALQVTRNVASMLEERGPSKLTVPSEGKDHEAATAIPSP